MPLPPDSSASNPGAGGADDSIGRLAEELMPLFYAEVRRLAHHERRRVGASDTLQTTALVHEAYLKLFRAPSFQDHTHFLRAAAVAMRHALVNHARDRAALKRGGGAFLESLDEAQVPGVENDTTMLAVHEAVERLGRLSPRLAQVVECRFFAGYDEHDTGLALGIADRTVRRDWTKARAWLRRELGDALDFAQD